MTSPPWTLTRYLIEERRRFPQATGDLNALILDVSIACKAIARVVARGRLANDGRPAASAENLFVRMNASSGHLAGMVSRAASAPHRVPAHQLRGKYLLVFDALDGSSNADINAPVGSVFAILRASSHVIASGSDAGMDDFLQPGSAQVAAGYALYGPTTMFVLTVGNGVAGFTLDASVGEFMLTHPSIAIPEDTHEFAIDTSNAKAWSPGVRRYVDECLAGRRGARGVDFHMRWVASRVAEAHRILLRGGVFLHADDATERDASARLHLMVDANPLAFLIEQAGGRASTGRQPVLAVEPVAIDQPVDLLFGSRNEVERIERYHAEPDEDRSAPLFAHRGLFRV